MKASSESGLWATEISRNCEETELDGIDETELDIVSVPVANEDLTNELPDRPKPSYAFGLHESHADRASGLQYLAGKKGKYRRPENYARSLVADRG